MFEASRLTWTFGRLSGLPHFIRFKILWHFPDISLFYPHNLPYFIKFNCYDKIPWQFPDIDQVSKIPCQFPDPEKILFFSDFSLTRGNPDLHMQLTYILFNHPISNWTFLYTFCSLINPSSKLNWAAEDTTISWQWKVSALLPNSMWEWFSNKTTSQATTITFQP